SVGPVAAPECENPRRTGGCQGGRYQTRTDDLFRVKEARYQLRQSPWARGAENPAYMIRSGGLQSAARWGPRRGEMGNGMTAMRRGIVALAVAALTAGLLVAPTAAVAAPAV